MSFLRESSVLVSDLSAGTATDTACIVLSDPATGAATKLPLSALKAYLGTTSTTNPATAYTTALSGTSGTSGSPVTMTFTPGTGGWPSGEVITPTVSGVAGAFSPTTVSPSGTAAATCTFTPSATGTASLSSTTSPSLSNTTGALAYTVSAAAAPGIGPDAVLTGAVFGSPAKFGSAALINGSAKISLTRPAELRTAGLWYRSPGTQNSGPPILVTEAGNGLEELYNGLAAFSGAGGHYAGSNNVVVGDSTYHWLVAMDRSDGVIDYYCDGTFVVSLGSGAGGANPTYTVCAAGGTASTDFGAQTGVGVVDSLVIVSGRQSSLVPIPTAEFTSSLANALGVYNFNGNGVSA